MRTKLHKLVTGAVVVALAGVAQAATFYVSANGSDAGGGMQSQPWRTQAFAATQVNPGDTVLMMNGVYAPFVLTRSGTNAQPITWQAYPGHKPHVVYKQGKWVLIDVHRSSTA